MTVETSAAQPTCLGCCLNPGFINPFQFTHDPFNYQPQPNPFQPSPQPSAVFINTNDFVKLTLEERELLQRLGEAFNVYSALDKRSEADNKEFVDALHRLQQLVALRVARRVDPEVWAQPE